jgi:hypothetical protein
MTKPVDISQIRGVDTSEHKFAQVTKYLITSVGLLVMGLMGILLTPEQAALPVAIVAAAMKFALAHTSRGYSESRGNAKMGFVSIRALFLLLLISTLIIGLGMSSAGCGINYAKAHEGVKVVRLKITKDMDAKCSAVADKCEKCPTGQKCPGLAAKCKPLMVCWDQRRDLYKMTTAAQTSIGVASALDALGKSDKAASMVSGIAAIVLNIYAKLQAYERATTDTVPLLVKISPPGPPGPATLVEALTPASVPATVPAEALTPTEPAAAEGAK